MNKEDKDEVLRLANYLYGFGTAITDNEITAAASWLRKYAEEN